MNITTEIYLNELIKQFAKEHPDVREGFVFLPLNLTNTISRQIFDLEYYANMIKQDYKDEVREDVINEAIDFGDLISSDDFDCGDECVCEECPIAKLALEHGLIR